jgi:SAM-dependent methyltransferase
MKCEYDALALDYHWLVADQILAGESFLARHRSLVDSLSAGARILDCACGIGSAAIGLARRGYQVTASDASGSMVAEAERRAKVAVLDINFATCQWGDLPSRFNDPFDLVLCVGNSISHAPSRCAASRALAAMPCGPQTGWYVAHRYPELGEGAARTGSRHLAGHDDRPSRSSIPRTDKRPSAFV